MSLFHFTKSGMVVDATGHRTIGREGQIADFDEKTAAGAENGLLKPIDEKPAKKAKAQAGE